MLIILDSSGVEIERVEDVEAPVKAGAESREPQPELGLAFVEPSVEPE